MLLVALILVVILAKGLADSMPKFMQKILIK